MKTLLSKRMKSSEKISEKLEAEKEKIICEYVKIA